MLLTKVAPYQLSETDISAVAKRHLKRSTPVDYILSKEGYARAGVSRLSADNESHPTWLGYLRVEDVDATVAKAVSLGGEVMFGPDPSILNGNLVILADPIGAPFGVIRWTFDSDGEAQ